MTAYCLNSNHDQINRKTNQPDGMTVAEIQSRDDLPEELPGFFWS